VGNGGSSVVSCSQCSQTPPLQRLQPFTMCRKKLSLAKCCSRPMMRPGRWPFWPPALVIGGENRIYAPSPASRCSFANEAALESSPAWQPRIVLDFLDESTSTPSTSTPLPPLVRRDEQKNPLCRTRRARSSCANPDDEANGLWKMPSHYSRTPFAKKAIGIISDGSHGSGPSRIRDGASLTGHIRRGQVPRPSTDHDVGAVMACRDLQEMRHCCCCSRSSRTNPWFVHCSQLRDPHQDQFCNMHDALCAVMCVPVSLLMAKAKALWRRGPCRWMIRSSARRGCTISAKCHRHRCIISSQLC
jgi:hypothetical protein